METNIININRDVIREKLPADLLSFDEICKKYGLKYSYLYKKSRLEGKITMYKRGVWKLSESEILNFLDNESKKGISR